MTIRLPVVLGTADLPLAELCSACLDGELYPLGDGWCPVDQPTGADARARSIIAALPDAVILERMSAAWIHGAAGEPARFHLCIDVAERANVPPSARYTVREVRGVSGETVLLGGLRVTTPVRTLLDLCRDPSLSTSEVVPVIRWLLENGLVPLAAATDRVAEPRRLHRALAVRRFSAAT